MFPFSMVGERAGMESISWSGTSEEKERRRKGPATEGWKETEGHSRETGPAGVAEGDSRGGAQEKRRPR